ncbi:MAG: carbohydrate kinase family protein [Chloroflexota bacterium]
MNSPQSQATSRPDVVGLGYADWDHLAIVPGQPEFDTDTMTLQASAQCGGGPVATALVTLRRLGANVGYLGTLGDDEPGRRILTDLQRAGVDTTRLIVQPGERSHTCLVLVEANTGRRCILCDRGTLQPLQLTDADRQYICQARFLHLDGQFMDAAITAARWAQDSSVRVSFDANRPRPRLDELLPLVDVLVTSTSFPTACTGHDDLEKALQTLHTQGPETVVVTLGPQGCAYLDGNRLAHVPGYRVDVVDTTGAGDAFHGAFLYGLLQNWDARETARFANAVAALNCRSLGGRAALPTLAEARAFLRQ